MKIENIKSVLPILMVSTILSACTMIPKYQQPKVNIPEQYQYNHHADKQYSLIDVASLGWQDYFVDPRLHKLIELALANNTNLRVATLNAEAVRAKYMISRASLLPSIGVNGNGNRGRVAKDLSASGHSFISSSYSVGLGITGYELDLFGRVRSNNEAALQGYFASVANRDAAHLTLIASVAKAYFNQRYAEESMALAKKVLASREKTYQLTQLRHQAGVISAVDLRQQEALIESTRADYATAVQAREQAVNSLALLINQPIPQDLPQGLPLNQQFSIRELPAGMPSELLLNRPDIRSAEFALKQANANIGAARAAFFPRISLTSAIGSSSNELSGLFQGGNRIWSFAPNITLPIFSWGSNKANLDYAKLMKQVEIANYEAAVQSAFRDVSNALVAREQLDKAYQANLKQGQAYSDYLRLVHLRYQHGVANALDLQDAERSSYAADNKILSTQLMRMENLVDLYKALGGGLNRYSTNSQAKDKIN